MSNITTILISDDITKNDDKLSFNFQNRIEYQFDSTVDRYLLNAGQPIGYIGGGPSSELADIGYKLKKVASENITVEIYADVNNNLFFEKTFAVDYYIQTKEAGGSGDDTIDIQDDQIEEDRLGII